MRWLLILGVSFVNLALPLFLSTVSIPEYVPIMAIVLLAAALIAFFWARKPIPTTLSEFALLGFIGLIFALHFIIAEYAAEKLHLIQYFVLAIIYERLCTGKQKRGQVGIRPVPFFLCAVVGLFDEVIQSQIPGRFFQWSDVYLNYVGSSCGILPYKIMKNEK